MSSIHLRRGGILTLVAALLATVTLAACGGDSSDVDDRGGVDSPSGRPATTSAPSTPNTGAATQSAGGAAPDGAKIFASAGCASCHTLKAADSNGQVGPNLDDLKPSERWSTKQVTNGGGGMPSFKDALSPAEIQAVSDYVADNAGQ